MPRRFLRQPGVLRYNHVVSPRAPSAGATDLRPAATPAAARGVGSPERGRPGRATHSGGSRDRAAGALSRSPDVRREAAARGGAPDPGPASSPSSGAGGPRGPAGASLPGNPRVSRSRSPARPLSRAEHTRADAPALFPYQRGSRATALAVASSPTRRARARQTLEDRIFARASVRTHSQVESLWATIAAAAGHSRTCLTPESILDVAGILVEAGFRSTPQYLARAKLAHLALGHPWTDQLALAHRHANRAARRGLGAARATAAFPMDRVSELDSATTWSASGPLGPQAALTVGLWWLLREVELANILISDVTFPSAGEVTLHLPASKTDTSGRGAARTLSCACGRCPGATASLPHILCPACAVLGQLERLAQAGFPHPDRSPNLPLFPDVSGRVVSKNTWVETITAAAIQLRLPLQNTNNSFAWGGHALRRGGAQYLARSGVDVWRIQAMARHSTSQILTYIEGEHFATLNSIPMEAALHRDLENARMELSHLRAQAVSNSTPASSSTAPQEPAQAPQRPTRPYVLAAKGTRIHLRAKTTGFARCGWFYARAQHRFLASALSDNPGDVVPLCSICARQPSTSSSSSSGRE